jgi:hypothetical protein
MDGLATAQVVDAALAGPAALASVVLSTLQVANPENRAQTGAECRVDYLLGSVVADRTGRIPDPVFIAILDRLSAAALASPQFPQDATPE